MYARFRKLILAAGLALPHAMPALAGEVISPSIVQAVPGSGATYFELLRQVLPDLAPKGESYRAHAVIDMRHLGGPDYGTAPRAEPSIDRIDVLPVRAEGRDRLAVLIDLGSDEPEGFAVLALFDPSSSPELMDAAQVGFDRATGFATPANVPLGPGDDLLLTTSTHFNVHQAYAITAMSFVREGRLELVDTVLTLGDRACGFERTQFPEFRAGERGDRPYADIIVTVTEETKLTGEDCGSVELPAAATRTVEATYRWDAGRMRFLPDSDALEVLARETEARF